MQSEKSDSSHCFLGSLIPRRPLALVFAVFCCLEIGLLVSRPKGIYFAGGTVPVFASVFVAWFWVTLTFLMQAVCQTAVMKERGLFRLLAGSVLALLLVPHVVSWGLFLRTGRFLNLDAVLFILHNPPQTTWLYLTAAERAAVVSAAIAFVVLIPLGTLGVKRHSGGPKTSIWPVWFRLNMVVVLLWAVIFLDASEQRRKQRYDALCNTLHPAFTLMTSVLDVFSLEKIEPCLDQNQLHPLTDWTPSAKSNKASHPNVIFLAIESLRPDVIYREHQGREVTPHLNRLARAGLRFTNAYAQSTHSDYSDVCIVSSLYPLRTRRHHYYQHHDPWPKTLAFDVFKQEGYRTAIVSSQNESWGGMDRFLDTPSLDLFYDAERSQNPDVSYCSERDPGLAYERKVGTFSAGCLFDWHTMDTALGWIQSCQKDETPFFLSMNFQSSHFPYEVPEDGERPFQPSHLDDDVSFMSYPREKTSLVRNAYFNGVHYCDQQLGRLVDALRESGQLDNTILVVMGENGEAFHENGRVGHAQHPFESMLRVAAVIHAPALIAPRDEDYPVELIDILPTVCRLAGPEHHPGFQGIDVLAANRPGMEDRYLYFHVNCASANADAVQWAGRWKYVMDQETGRNGLFDLQTDPGESQNVKQQHPVIASRLQKILKRWRARQLAYYHYPMYYSRYFPPAPPTACTPPAQKSAQDVARRSDTQL